MLVIFCIVRLLCQGSNLVYRANAVLIEICEARAGGKANTKDHATCIDCLSW